MDKDVREALNHMASRYNKLCDQIENLHGQIEYLKKRVDALESDHEETL